MIMLSVGDEKILSYVLDNVKKPVFWEDLDK